MSKYKPGKCGNKDCQHMKAVSRNGHIYPYCKTHWNQYCYRQQHKLDRAAAFHDIFAKHGLL